MRAMGLHGVIRGKSVRTTIQDKAAPCPQESRAKATQAVMNISIKTAEDGSVRNFVCRPD